MHTHAHDGEGIAILFSPCAMSVTVVRTPTCQYFLLVWERGNEQVKLHCFVWMLICLQNRSMSKIEQNKKSQEGGKIKQQQQPNLSSWLRRENTRLHVSLWCQKAWWLAPCTRLHNPNKYTWACEQQKYRVGQGSLKRRWSKTLHAHVKTLWLQSKCSFFQRRIWEFRRRDSRSGHSSVECALSLFFHRQRNLAKRWGWGRRCHLTMTKNSAGDDGTSVASLHLFSSSSSSSPSERIALTFVHARVRGHRQWDRPSSPLAWLSR